MEQKKTCTKCNTEKSLDQFYKHKGCRLGVDNKCKSCAIRDATKYQLDNPERAKLKNEKWNLENKERARQNKQTWNNANRDKRKLFVDKWAKENPEKVKASKAKWRRNNPEATLVASRIRKSVPKIRLEGAISAGVRRSISRGSKYGRKTFDLLGYSADELRNHIEKQFDFGMSWENYAHDTWHIDHKFPLASFNYTTPDCHDFKKAWALDNLQPMWAAENMSKGSRLDHPTQLAA